MLKVDTNNMSDTSEDPSSSSPKRASQHATTSQEGVNSTGLLSKFKSIFGRQKNGSEILREALEDYIEDVSDNNSQTPSIAEHEKALIKNILTLQSRTVDDVMIPRADIIAIDIQASQEQLMELLSEHQYSRIPVYSDTMDDISGTVHIKDILSSLAKNKKIKLKELLRNVPIVSPSLPVLDLLMKMQQDKKHMALVVDEYGGIDGLVTVGDVIESIVGEIEDEFDQDTPPQITQKPDGTIVADARLDIEDFEETYGKIFSEEEHDEIDTLGGLVFYIAGRIPARGEVITHSSGMVFEILEADQRRISTLKIRDIPTPDEE